MTTVLSGSRPIVALVSITYSFTTRSSNCRMSFGIVLSLTSSSPVVRQTSPPTVLHFHNEHRDVVDAAIGIGGFNQVLADPLGMPESDDGLGQHPLRHHARQAV